MSPLRSLLLLAAAAALAPGARADVVISNFSAPVGVGTAFGGGASTQYKAFGFTMGASAYELDDVILSMNFANAGAVPEVSIWSDAGGSPGSQLFTLDNPATLFGQMDFTFTAGAPFRLEPATTYWVHVVSVPVGGTAFLWDGTSPATLPSGIASAVGYEFNGNSSSFYNRLEVNGTLDGGIGASYCGPAALNSTGAPGALEVTGSAVVLDDDVTLEATDLPANAFGFFLASRTQALVPNAGGSQGTLCLGGQIGRYVGPGQIQNSGAAGAFSLSLDLTSVPQPTGLVAVMAGETWNFQAWFRDAVSGSATSNFTNGSSVDFL